MMKKYSYITEIDKLPICEREKSELKKVIGNFPFKSNDYYLSLIDWNDPDDPIRRIIIPHIRELNDWGNLDPSDEEAYTVIPGLEHKYHSTALLLVSENCAGFCRYCFRKRVFLDSHKKESLELDAALKYISHHTEITNVLLTGGDPLMLAAETLGDIIGRLRQIEHVQIIRIGTRMPVFNPYRIIEDSVLISMFQKYSSPRKKLYIMTHFDHPRELTDAAANAIYMLQKAGVIIANQNPLIRGLNDDPAVLAELFRQLSFIGAVPYYVFQCRPAIGNRAYTVPIEEGYDIFEDARSRVSGLAKRARFVMSHSNGKIEVIGRNAGMVWLKYHRAFLDADSGRIMVFKSNPKAYWLDDYEEEIKLYPASKAYRFHGP